MLGLPKATEMSKQLPKKAIYTKFQMNTAAKAKIDADISRITIVNEIAPNKVNIPAGEDVKKKKYDEKTIATLSKLIPQNILFVLEYENESRLAIYHIKVMQTEWKPTENQQIELQGLNLDTVWENIVKGLECGVWNEELSLDENIALHNKQEQLKKQIEKLEKQARAERQPKKKFELVKKAKELKEELSSLSSSTKNMLNMEQ